VKGVAVREQMNGIDEAPGKTWFWELAAGVIEADRCIQCGTCVAVCPSSSIGVSEDSGLPELVKMCTGCSLCWDFCPRGGLRYEALWPPSSDLAPASAGSVSAGSASAGLVSAGSVSAGSGTSTAVTIGRTSVSPAEEGEEPSTITGGPPGDGLGSVVATYAVRSSVRRKGAQDGGVVTAMLTALLRAGEIDGALVSVPSDDPGEPWKGVATVATTPEEVAASSGSFYNQTMALAELDLSGRGLPENPRLAVVGTPCEVQGIRAMQARRWPTGAHRVDAVVLTIALMCTKSFDYTGLVLRELAERRRVDLQRVSKVDVIRGRMIVRYRDGHVAVDEPVKRFHGAALKGCEECADFLGRAADLTVGSVGSLDGWTSVLVRSDRGRRALDRARPGLDVRSLDDPAALERLDRLDKRTALGALARTFDPGAPLFMDYQEHVRAYDGTDRRPVVRAR